MSDVNVLVVFYSRYGRAERIALSAGVGAIEAEGNIRLRRLPDLAAPEVIEADAAWRAAVARMNRDYVAPRPADPVWADVIVLATPADRAVEICAYAAGLPALCDVSRKLAAPLTANHAREPLAALCAVLGQSGLVSVPLAVTDADADVVTSARLHGQRLVRMARALKNAG